MLISNDTLENNEHKQEFLFYFVELIVSGFQHPEMKMPLKDQGALRTFFSNNLTNEGMKELLVHSFSDHLDADDLPR